LLLQCARDEVAIVEEVATAGGLLQSGVIRCERIPQLTGMRERVPAVIK